MKLHENKTLFRQAVQFTSDQRQTLPIYVEKDYWVAYALNTLFRHEIGSDTVFKGGTALSCPPHFPVLPSSRNYQRRIRKKVKFANIHVDLLDGRHYGQNVWTFKFLLTLYLNHMRVHFVIEASTSKFILQHLVVM